MKSTFQKAAVANGDQSKISNPTMIPTKQKAINGTLKSYRI